MFNKTKVPTEIKSNCFSIPIDKPISSPSEDVLGRQKVACSFARQVLLLDPSEGVVVGVLGPWGSGKTSFVNLARDYFIKNNIEVLDYNPWMFSGADQLVDSFFREISAQLKLRPNLADIGKCLESYGEIFSKMDWIPFVGSWIGNGGKATKLLAEYFKNKEKGAGSRQQTIISVLRKLEKPFIVVIDDIDRLTTTEIRNIFKLVRLTANFPNIVYIVAFDRNRVETALSEQGISGRDYLEKILQVGIDLPAIPDHLLNTQIFRELDKALENVSKIGRFDQTVWPDVFSEIIRPLLRNMRDVRRYSATIQCTLNDLDGQVALVDVLALEAIRIFLPDVFIQLNSSVDGLTTISSNVLSRGTSEERLKKQIEQLIKFSGEYNEIIKSLIQRLFPGGSRHIGGADYNSESRNHWLRDRRIAHENILRFYLERSIGDGLKAFSNAEKAWNLMHNGDEFNSFMRSIDAGQQQDVISALEVYQDKYRLEQIVPASVTLLNLLPSLPRRKQGLLEYDPNTAVKRIVFRLLKTQSDLTIIENAVCNILEQVISLNSKSELILLVGFQERGGHKLV